MTYGIYVWSEGKHHFVTSGAILAEYARQGRQPLESLTEITTHGIRYSNQDFDVLSGALRHLGVSAESLTRL